MTVTVPPERVFTALADGTRRDLLVLVADRPSSSASALARALPVSRQAIVKHLTVLSDAGLVSSEKTGREMCFRVRPEQLTATAAWMNSLAAAWDARLQELKARAEHPE
ncbi:DNA-binding transcriptional ArsR family regulator [Nakamurella sp. UYEF19]|uniref:ArsR/SmtB family transcription factor n=1 Tax=Nakamurella sp. UYEF19 TaxID=1756392 RepID=UPI0033978C49